MTEFPADVLVVDHDGVAAHFDCQPKQELVFGVDRVSLCGLIITLARTTWSRSD
jgi:hypothetical protein